MKLVRPGLLAAVALAVGSGGTVAQAANESASFRGPERVTIRGYHGDAMEPFVSRNGKYLFFNDLNDPSVNTQLHYAVRIDDTTFAYKAAIRGVDTEALETVPSMDRENAFYIVSTRS